MQQSGFLIGWSSPVLARLQGPNSTIPLTSSQGGWVATMVPLTSAITTPVSAVCMHCLGRRISLMIPILPLIIFWIMCSVATTYVELLIARLIAGIGMSYLYTITPVYLGEISPDNIRGGLGIGMNVMTQIGTVWIYYIGTYPELWVSSVSCIAPLIVVILLFIFVPESPYFLVQINEADKAKEVLQMLTHSEDIEVEYNKVVAAMHTDSKKNIVKEIFTERYHRRALFVCLGTFSIAQLTGGVSFLYFAHLIFERALKDTGVSPDTMVLIKATLQVFSCLLAAFVVDTIGRKPLLIISCTGSAIFMFLIGLYFLLHDNGVNVDVIWWLPLVSLVLFNNFQVVGLTSISVSYMGELFHPKIKAVAVCICKFHFALLVFIIGKLFQVFTDAFGNCVPFFIFASMGILGIFFVVFIVPETKGRSLEEIQYYFKNNAYRT